MKEYNQTCFGLKGGFKKLQILLSSREQESEDLGWTILKQSIKNRSAYKEFKSFTYSKKSRNIHLKWHHRMEIYLNRLARGVA